MAWFAVLVLDPKGLPGFLRNLVMASYHKWVVKNVFTFVLQFFSLISGGVRSHSFSCYFLSFCLWKWELVEKFQGTNLPTLDSDYYVVHTWYLLLVEKLCCIAWWLWQYGLWSFQMGCIKLERFLPKNQHTQRKFFEFWELD